MSTGGKFNFSPAQADTRLFEVRNLKNKIKEYSHSVLIAHERSSNVCKIK